MPREQIWKSGPLPREVTFDPLLTTMAVAYWQDLAAFSTRQVFPVVPVNLSSGKYKLYERGAFYRDDFGPRPRGGMLPVVGFGMTEDDYSCEEEGLSTFIDERDRANTVTPVQLERAKIRLLTQQSHTHYERLWAASFFKTGVWATDMLGVAAAPAAGQFLQFDQTGMDPVPFIRKERAAFELRTGGFAANAIVMGEAVFRNLIDHPEIRDRIQYTQIGVADIQLLMRLLGVDFLAVARSVWNAAKEGQAEDLQRILSARDFLLCHRTTEPSTDMPTAGVTFAWTGLIPGGGLPNGTEVAVNRWRPNPYAENFDVRMAMGQKLVATDLGVFYKDAVSAAAV